MCEQHSDHGHAHTHTQTRAVVNRLARARSALNNTGKVILKDHLEHCIVDAMSTQDRAAIDELNRAIEQFVK